MTSLDREPASPRIRGLDGLRALSALLVFCEHKVTRYTVGVLGVWIFFVLSGYLISGILQNAVGRSEHRGGNGRLAELGNFWRNRALRILPVYYLTLVVLALGTTLVTSAELPWYAVYLQNFYIAFVTHAWSPITHFWSLAIEQQFYILAAPLLLWSPLHKHAAVWWAVLLASVASVVALEISGFDPMALSLLPSTNIAFMAAGGLIRVTGAGACRSLLVHPLGLIGLALTFVLAFFFGTEATDPFAGTPLALYIAGLGFSTSVVASVTDRPESLLVRLLEFPLLRWFGTVSYGFYVYHALMPTPAELAEALGLDGTALAHVPWRLWNLIQFGASLAVAEISWRWVERPILALKRTKASRPQAAEGPSAPV